MTVEQGYSPHHLISFGGKLGGGEIWTCGVRAMGNNGEDPDYGNYLKDLKDGLTAYWGNPNNGIATTAKLSWAKCNKIGPDGRYVDKSTTHVIDIPDVAGGTSAQMPAFLSVAYTWTTVKTRGPGTRGHVYLPNYGFQAAAGLDPCMVSVAEQEAMVTSGKKLLACISNGVGIDAGGPVDVIDFVPVIASKVDKSLTIINGVSVGRVYDVQRRRKNAIEENPVHHPWDWQNPGA